MKGRILKVLIITFIYNVIVISCCNEPDTYSKIIDFSINIRDFSNDNEPLYDQDTTNAEKLVLILDFDYTYESSIRINFSNNNCYALKCKEGQKGLKNKVKTINITSSNDFNDYNAGEILNDLITCSYNQPDGDQHQLNNVPIQTAINSINTWDDFFLHYSFNFIINEKPLNTSRHKFTMKIEFMNGDILTKDTEEIIWE